MARLRAAAAVVLAVTALWAQEKAQPKVSSPGRAKSTLPAAGDISDGIYRNPSFGFSYKLPYGWVDRTADMQDDSAAAAKSRVLLAIFERPPEATGDTINSAVVIAVEPLPAGIKTAAEYLDSLAALTTSKGFQAEEQPHQFAVGTTRLVRADFSKARGKLSMHQVSLAEVEKGYSISFTFIGGSADEVNELIEKLSFAPQKSL